jgi:hypothetical protein
MSIRERLQGGLRELDLRTSDEVAAKLCGLKIKGGITSIDCPVAIFLSNVVERPISVRAFGGARPLGVRSYDDIPLPYSVQQFVLEYDHGKFPDLRVLPLS